jgi:hypothetical protein
MFGNNAITSSWTNPQQNQTQQPGTSAFGQPTSTFGSTGVFKTFARCFLLTFRKVSALQLVLLVNRNNNSQLIRCLVAWAEQVTRTLAVSVRVFLSHSVLFSYSI